MGSGRRPGRLTVATGTKREKEKEHLRKLFTEFEVKFTGPLPKPSEYSKNIVQATTEFLAENREEIPLLPGDLVELLSERTGSSDGWWTGRRCGQTGLFPKDMVTFFPSDKVHKVAIARVDYIASSPAEISFREGELMEIIVEPLLERTFYTARIRDQEGTVESGYVEWLNEDDNVDIVAMFSNAKVQPQHEGMRLDSGPTSIELEELQIAPLSPSPRTTKLDLFVNNDVSVSPSILAEKLGEVKNRQNGSDRKTPVSEAGLAVNVKEVASTPNVTVTEQESPIKKQTQATQGTTEPKETKEGNEGIQKRKDTMRSTLSPSVEINFDELVLDYPCIGRGAFSTVHRATFVNSDEVVAVKLLLHSKSDKPDHMRTILIAEANTFAGLRHKNIVGFRGICRAAPNYALVMEFVDDGVLRSHLDDTLEPIKLLDWATQLATGVNYLHEEAPTSIIHRDLKSLNVLVASGTSQTLKISDFGMAREYTHTAKMSGARGTAAWMAPEVIRSGTFSKGADIWSYGVVLWEMLTRQVPYKGVEQTTIYFGIGRGNLTLPIPTDCPRPFDTLLRQCWKPEPKDRPSFQRILDQLRKPTARGFGETPRHSLILKQSDWETLIPNDLQDKLQDIDEKSALLDNQERGLGERTQAIEAQEAELDRKTHELVKSMAVISMKEVALRSPSLSGKSPTKQIARKWQRKPIVKSDIGSPANFVHVEHIPSHTRSRSGTFEISNLDLDRKNFGSAPERSPPPPHEFATATSTTNNNNNNNNSSSSSSNNNNNNNNNSSSSNTHHHSNSNFMQDTGNNDADNSSSNVDHVKLRNRGRSHKRENDHDQNRHNTQRNHHQNNTTPANNSDDNHNNYHNNSNNNVTNNDNITNNPQQQQQQQQQQHTTNNHNHNNNNTNNFNNNSNNDDSNLHNIHNHNHHPRTHDNNHATGFDDDEVDLSSQKTARLDSSTDGSQWESQL